MTDDDLEGRLASLQAELAARDQELAATSAELQSYQRQVSDQRRALVGRDKVLEFMRKLRSLTVTSHVHSVLNSLAGLLTEATETKIGYRIYEEHRDMPLYTVDEESVDEESVSTYSQTDLWVRIDGAFGVDFLSTDPGMLNQYLLDYPDVRKEIESVLRRSWEKNDLLRDPLTGAFNRRYIRDTLMPAVANRMRGFRDDSYTQFGVSILDIDHFKQVNDTHGHNKGDQVLCTVVRALQRRFRGEQDPVVRWGGEEILVVPLGEDIERTSFLAEEARRVVEAEVKSPEQITVSVGYAHSTQIQDEINLLFSGGGRTFVEDLLQRNTILVRSLLEEDSVFGGYVSNMVYPDMDSLVEYVHMLKQGGVAVDMTPGVVEVIEGYNPGATFFQRKQYVERSFQQRLAIEDYETRFKEEVDSLIAENGSGKYVLQNGIGMNPYQRLQKLLRTITDVYITGGELVRGYDNPMDMVHDRRNHADAVIAFYMLLGIADNHLYDAKRNGRNQVRGPLSEPLPQKGK